MIELFVQNQKTNFLKHNIFHFSCIVFPISDPFPASDLRPVSWRTSWRICRVGANSSSSSSCLGASLRSGDQPRLHPHLPQFLLVPLWKTRTSSATSCRRLTAAAPVAPPASTEPYPPPALQVGLIFKIF